MKNKNYTETHAISYIKTFGFKVKDRKILGNNAKSNSNKGSACIDYLVKRGFIYLPNKA